jgi:hypothetical protein
MKSDENFRWGSQSNSMLPNGKKIESEPPKIGDDFKKKL